MWDIENEIKNLMKDELGCKFTKYYTGKVQSVPINYLPILMVYGTTTTLEPSHTTCRDKQDHTINIEIVSTAFGFVNQNEDENEEQKAQKELKILMEDREEDGTPKAQTVLGILRRNIRGNKYLFNDNITIEYPQEPAKTQDNTYYRAVLTFTAHRQYSNRT